MTPDRTLDEARTFLKMGYLAGALERAVRLCGHSELGLSARHVAWLASVYLGPKHHGDARKITDVPEILRGLPGSPGVVEAIWLLGTKGDLAGAASEIDRLLEFADSQHGLLVTWHPTALIGLAELAGIALGNERTARLLTCMVLRHRPVFVSIDDVDRLAGLLRSLRAPISLWAEWCAILIRHIGFATVRPELFSKEFKTPGPSRWARKEDAASEAVVRKVLAEAPHEVWGLLQEVARHLGAAPFAEVVARKFSPGDLESPSDVDRLWDTTQAVRYRYFWYDMVTDAEKDLVRNGDWAIFNTPTRDFSMALAQWWRALESVLKRAIIGKVTMAFAQHPEWATWDRENLSKEAQKRESLFLDKFSAPEPAAKTTLGDILLLFKKCEATTEKGSGGSRLRREAARLLEQHRDQIGPLTKHTWLSPAHLTDENITWFRNRSSHDAPADRLVASTGRLLARRILDGFFAPALKKWGFEPTLL